MGTPQIDVLDRVRNFNAALDKLMSLYTNNASPIEEFVKVVTEEASNMLQLDRVSIWSFSKNKQTIHCLDLFTANSDQHLNGATLSATDFPRYFNAVLDARVIDASDAVTDPRTSEFDATYLAPNRIVSMLDSQIRSAAGPRGVVCAESVDVKRDWTPDEIAFIVSIAELVGFSMDRQDRQRVLSQLEETNEKLETAIQREQDVRIRYDLALNAAVDGIWDWNLLTGEVFFTEQNAVLLGEKPSILESNGTTNYDWWETRIHPADLPVVKESLKNHLKSEKPYDLTYRIRHTDGSWRWWRSRGEAQRTADRIPIRLVGTNSDVTGLVVARQELERKNSDLISAKERIEAVALEDPLTKLPNRRYLENVAETLIDEAKLQHDEVAFLHIDLDKFKAINDQLGHAAGDHVLCKFADILRNSVGANHFVARTGGDEFVAILTDQKCRKALLTLADNLVEKLNAPIVYENQDCIVGASIGISFLDGNDVTAAELLSNADLALYSAKKLGRNRVEIFSKQMGEAAESKRKLHAEILNALEQDEFVPYFQPQFHANSLRLSGVEVLARWNHPVRGVLTPPAFLNAAEELGQVAGIDKLILEKSVSIVEEWERVGFYVPSMSVNVSCTRLNDPNLVKTVESLNLKRDFLSFELLESIFLDQICPVLHQNLERLRELGVKIEIDDFGTGYASIASLINIRPHRLKIDRQLIMDIEEDDAISELVQSVVVIAECLNIQVVAEGVETDEQVKLLTEAGCQFLQGFKLGHPVTAEALYERFRPKNEATAATPRIPILSQQ